MKREILISAWCLASLLLPPSVASAAVVWSGNLETGDLSQWSFVANGQYIDVQGELVAEGSNAAWIELHNDAVWPNGLKRVELQHLPLPVRTGEGATTYFAWSFYLPQALPEGSNQAIGYWESNNTWQQVMALNARGQDLVFQTRRPMNVLQWEGAGLATPGEWHRVTMRVTWSTNAGLGSVSLWFDGQLVVDEAGAQTLADNNPHFVQVGLLREAIEFADAPVIVIDDAVEGDSLEDVRFDDLPDASGDDGGSSGGGMDDGRGDDGLDTSGGGDGAGSSDDGGLDTSGGPGEPPEPPGDGSEGTAGPGLATGFGGEDDQAQVDGCSCRSTRGGPTAGVLALWLLALARRRRRP